MANLYGLPEMSYEEEKNLPENKKRIVRDKISIVDKCGLMKTAVEQIRFRARGVPVLDDNDHADRIDEWEHMVDEANELLWKIATHGVR